jgi:hypothetical protein
MEEAFVRLSCPDCEKNWENNPTDLHPPREEFTCPDCGGTRRLAEFMRMERDLETLEQFH